MMRKSLLGIGLAVGVSALALGACDRAPWDQGETSDAATPSDVSSARTACIDPATGELIQPGPDVDCNVPAPASSGDKPVVRDLEGGGKAIDLKGQQDQYQVKPAGQERMAVIDRETGKLVTSRPDDVLAAARYDRSIARARSIMKRQQARSSNADAASLALYPETLPTGGIKIDVKGRFQIPLVAKLSKDGRVHLRHQH